jgi:glycosyltransferase involved in cell wall biosynthesis
MEIFRNSALPTIVIDGVFFQINQRSGIARVWRSLLQSWSASGFIKHFIFLDRQGTAPFIPDLQYWYMEDYDYRYTPKDSQQLQAICDQFQADLFISTYYTTPLLTPSVFLAHDMIPERLEMDLQEPCWLEKHYGILHASHYLGVSQNTLQDLQYYFPHISREMMTLAYCGVDKTFSPATRSAMTQFRENYGINRPYVLLVGERIGIDGYKNALALFQDLARSPQPLDFGVLCVGGQAELEPELAELSQGITTWILPLEDEMLKIAYSGAIALIYPSLYEGFGLPILEAMACACPVITSHHASIPEVAGEAAHYVKIPQTDIWLTAIAQVQEPRYRQQLIAAGLQQAKLFSWSSMANIVAHTLFKVIASIQNQEAAPVSPLWLTVRSQQAELNRLRTELAEIQLTLTNYEYQTQAILEDLKVDQKTAQAEIAAMKSSKFWKLRNLWHRFWFRS